MSAAWVDRCGRVEYGARVLAAWRDENAQDRRSRLRAVAMRFVRAKQRAIARPGRWA